AGDRMAHVYAIADFESRDAFANGVHYARAFASWNVGQLRFDRIRSGAHVGVERVHARRVDAYDGLSCASVGSGEFLELHHLGRSEFVHDDRFHAWVLPWPEAVVLFREREFWRLKLPKSICRVQVAQTSVCGSACVHRSQKPQTEVCATQTSGRS